MDGKWITGLTPETPADEAAMRVLRVRLEVVGRQLPAAAERAHEDVEHVHQLRVATRRAGAALRIFGTLLPKTPLRGAKDLLREVRRAAGSARDWDVFLDALGRSQALTDPGARPATLFLTGYALGHRTAAQDGLTATAAARRDAIADLVESLPQAVQKPKRPGKQSFGDFAHAQLGDLFDEFNAEIAVGPSSPLGMHQLRITAKRVRYAMEVFSACYEPAFRSELYAAVEGVQEILGVVQDGHVGVERLEAARAKLSAARPELAGEVGPGIDAVEGELRQRSAAAQAEFRDWMAAWESLHARLPLDSLRPRPVEAPLPPD